MLHPLGPFLCETDGWSPLLEGQTDEERIKKSAFCSVSWSKSGSGKQHDVANGEKNFNFVIEVLGSTSRWGPFLPALGMGMGTLGLLDFVLRAFWALRLCDPRSVDPTDSVLACATGCG